MDFTRDSNIPIHQGTNASVKDLNACCKII